MKTIKLVDGSECVVSDWNYHELVHFSWKWGKLGVFRTERFFSDKTKSYQYKSVPMHRQITHCGDNEVVEHMDGNRRNNMRENLRVWKNNDAGKPAIQKHDRDRMSKYIGVEWDLDRTRWRVTDPKNKQLVGRFMSEDVAAREYDEYMISTYGEVSELNFPTEEYPHLGEPETEIQCRACGIFKPRTKFFRNPLSKNGRDVRCKDCRAEYQKKQAKEQREIVRNKYIELKSVPCHDCHTQYPHYVMQFHHKNPKHKTINISNIGSMRKLLAESQKCVVLCSNCHLEREWGENGLSRKRLEENNREF